MLKKCFQLFIVLMPWPIKRAMLQRFFGYQLSKKARIGISWVFPKKLIMDEYSSISHFTVAIHLEQMDLNAYSKIGRSNWITGHPISSKKHFQHITNRKSQLILGEHSAITKNHHIDCTEMISIGSYTIVAGYRSQFLTHSINIEESIQDAHPIKIGNYCFIGTNVVILGGSSLPDYCVLGAKSMLSKKIKNTHTLVGGGPAKEIKKINPDSKYFQRTTGFVN